MTRDSKTLLLKLLVRTLEWILRPSLYQTLLKTGRSFPGSFLDLYLVDAQTLYYLSATFTFLLHLPLIVGGVLTANWVVPPWCSSQGEQTLN